MFKIFGSGSGKYNIRSGPKNCDIINLRPGSGFGKAIFQKYADLIESYGNENSFLFLLNSLEQFFYLPLKWRVIFFIIVHYIDFFYNLKLIL